MSQNVISENVQLTYFTLPVYLCDLHIYHVSKYVVFIKYWIYNKHIKYLNTNLCYKRLLKINQVGYLMKDYFRSYEIHGSPTQLLNIYCTIGKHKNISKQYTDTN